MKTVLIIGGGVSGLMASILLSRQGLECTVIEKKSYPLHRVCGEYISNETLPFLKAHDLYPEEVNPPQISKFQLTSISGKSQILPLDMGGFGVSRFFFDDFLFRKAKEAGVTFVLNTSVDNVEFLGQTFRVTTSTNQWEANVVLGCFGKRSNLDSRLQRNFTRTRSPYAGVKYHIAMDYPSNLVSLHNFPGGYCGISPVENQKINLCYLIARNKIREFKNIPEMEKKLLATNPFLHDVFQAAEFLFSKPEVINEISFEKKDPVENHILMLGDASGLITPLCGNGIAMAIHAAKLAAEHVGTFLQNESPAAREQMEQGYAQAWNSQFSRRLKIGRIIQNLFGSEVASSFAVNLALYVRPVAMEIIRNTHGKTF